MILTLASWVRTLGGVGLLLITPLLVADDNPLDGVAAFLDDQTLMVGRVDLSQVDMSAAWSWLQSGAGPGELSKAPPALQAVRSTLSAVQRSGVRHVYVIWSVADVVATRPPAVFASAPQPTAVREALQPLLPPGRLHQLDRKGEPSMIILGDVAVRDRFRRAVDSPAPDDAAARRADLAAAAAAATAHPHFVVLGLTEDLKKVLRESLPDLPRELGGARGPQLAASVRWAMIGAKLPPAPLSVAVRIRSEDAGAAQALAGTIDAVLPLAPANFSQLVQATQEGRLVRVDLRDRNGQLAALAARLVGNGQLRSDGAHVANRLKQVGLAVHNYHNRYRSFPPFANGDKQGRPLLSWRVHLLPFLEHKELYEKFHLNEPWDSDHNRRLIAEMPDAYKLGGEPGPGKTRVQTPLMPGTLMGDRQVPRIRDVTDGLSNTVLTLAVPPQKAVIWTRPNDIRIDSSKPLEGLFAEGDQLWVGFCDGSARLLRKTELTAKLWRALLTKAGREPVKD